MTHSHLTTPDRLKHWRGIGMCQSMPIKGQASYSPADPLVGGGLTALLCPLFPRSPVDVEESLKILPADRTLPAMPGWV
jgi:hypothetical protein